MIRQIKISYLTFTKTILVKIKPSITLTSIIILILKIFINISLDHILQFRYESLVEALYLLNSLLKTSFILLTINAIINMTNTK